MVGLLSLFRADLITLQVSGQFTPEQLHDLARLELPALESEGEDEEGEPIAPGLYLRGKVIVIQMGLTSKDLGGKYGSEWVIPPTVEGDFGRLPGFMRASGPSDVDTVVAVRKAFGKHVRDLGVEGMAALLEFAPTLPRLWQIRVSEPVGKWKRGTKKTLRETLPLLDYKNW